MKKDQIINRINNGEKIIHEQGGYGKDYYYFNKFGLDNLINKKQFELYKNYAIILIMKKKIKHGLEVKLIKHTIGNLKNNTSFNNL